MTSRRKGQVSQVREAAQKGATVKPAVQDLLRLSQQPGPGVLRRAVAEPGRAMPSDIQALQRAYGNRAVTGLIQPRLMVGPVGDQYEQEADRVAEQVTSMPSPAASPPANGKGKFVLRQAEKESLQMKPASRADGGSPLPTKVRTFTEPRLGADFSGMRVYTDSEAAQMSQNLHTQAYTHGWDVYLAQGRYWPDTTVGKRLLAHELTHVVQQDGGTVDRATVQRWSFRKKKSATQQLPPTGKGEQAYIEALLADPSSLSKQEQALTGQKPQLPATGKGAQAYVKALQEDPSRMSEKERMLLGLLSAQSSEKEEAEETEETSPPKPTRWQKFKGKFKRKPKTLVDQIAKQLESEFKGYAGLKGVFTRTRKSQVTQKGQGGILTPVQERNIDALAALDPDKLTGLGFLLPSEAEAKARQSLFKPQVVANLPVKQQMQIATFQSRIEISRPQPATQEDRRRLEKLRAGPPRPLRALGGRPPRGQDLTSLAQEAMKKRAQIGFEPVKGARPEPEARAGAPSSEAVILKAGKGGEETAAHNVDSYRDIVAGYVKRAGIDQATIGQSAEKLVADYVDVAEAGQRYKSLAGEKQRVEEMRAGQSTASKKETKKLEARLRWAESGQKELVKALHEPDFAKAETDAKFRADSASKSSMAATQEKATIEYLYDEVEKKKAEVNKRKSGATRKQKKDANFNLETGRLEKAAADEAKGLVQQAKMSFDVIQVNRRSTDDSLTHVQEKLKRLPGTLRKIGGKIVTGALSAVVGIATLGIVGVKGKTDVKGYMGRGLEKKGWPIKATFLNDIKNQITQFRNTLKARPGGPGALDYTSGILRGFNEILVQNVINIASKLALITGILATILTVGAIATLGGTAAAAAVLATISAIATFVGLIAASLKVAVNLVRLTIDGLVALLNQDAKLSNLLGSRFKQAGMETMSDVAQVAGTALSAPTGAAIKGQEFINMFDPTKVIEMNVSALTAQSPGLARTAGATVAKVGIGVGMPLVMGPVAQGIKGATDEPYGLYTQHPDELGPTRAGRLEAQSKPSKVGDVPVDPTLPGWLRAELEKQNKLRSQVYKSRTAVALGQLTAVTSKSSELANKLNAGKSESEKLDAQLKDSKSKGNPDADNESLEMSRQQSGVLAGSAGAFSDTVEALEHSKREIKKLAD